MAKGSHYDKASADYAVGFIECLCHTKGTWARKPFELIDWQEQIIRDIFGTLKPNGYRQFNTAYIEIPKKQGKSELAAAVALLLTCGDGEERAEVYGCAADRQQASIVFNVAADMVRMCPALAKRVKILDSQKRLIYLPTGSIYQVLSADVGNKHGFNTHGVVFDELHTQPNRKLFDVMTKGSGDARMQPLYFLITTAGNDTKSICYGKYKYFWLYRVKFGIPAANLATKGDSITFSTPTIEGTILRRNKADSRGKHPWKAEVTEGDTTVAEETIVNWYNEVYEPTYTA